MVDRSLKIYQGEDLTPVTDLTDEVKWEEAEFGLRAHRGESTNSNVIIRDPNAVTGNSASLPAGLTAYSLAAGNVLEYVHGSNVRWRGRMGIKDYSRGSQRADRYREVAAYLEDINIDLRDIVVHNWNRPAETDVARIQALIAQYLSGSPRRTTIVNGSNLVNAGSNLVNLAAQNYVKTTTADVISDIATEANKTYFLRPRRRTSDAHTAELFYDGNNAVMESCPYRISDREDEVRASNHVFAPIWNVGPAATENGQELISGVYLFYGASDDSYVYVSDPVQANQYAWREIVVYDDTVVDAAAALKKARAILSFRKYEERVINVTIGPLSDAQLGSIWVGQTIQIKARAIAFADDQYYSGRISQLKETSPTPWTHFVHLQIDRPWRMGAYGTGSPVGPKAPSSEPISCSSGGTDTGWFNNGGFESNVNTDQNISPNWNHVVTTTGTARTGTYHGEIQPGGDIYHNFGGGRTFEAGKTYVVRGWMRARTGANGDPGQWYFGDPGSRWDDASYGEPMGSWVDNAYVDYRDSTTGVNMSETYTQYCILWTPSADRTNVVFYIAGALQSFLDDFALYEQSSGNTVPIGPTGSGSPGTDNDHYAPIDHVHEHGLLSDSGTHYHDGSQVAIADAGAYFTGTDVEAALQEIGADIAGLVSPTVVDHGSMGATETFNASAGSDHEGTQDANLSVTLTGATAGTAAWMTLKLTQDATGGRTLTLPASVVTKTDVEAAWDTTANAVNILSLFSYDGGTSWYGFLAGAGAAASSTHWEPVIFDNGGTPELVYYQDASGVWDIVMHEVAN
jgi:hypothetical protein